MKAMTAPSVDIKNFLERRPHHAIIHIWAELRPAGVVYGGRCADADPDMGLQDLMVRMSPQRGTHYVAMLLPFS
jgi:hypothetical protein